MKFTCVRACVRACVRGWVGGWVGGKEEERKLCTILRFSLRFVKVGGYDFPRPYDDGPWKSRFFLKRPLVDIDYACSMVMQCVITIPSIPLPH
jgi:hypothetical protein